MSEPQFSPGLAGVIAGKSSVGLVNGTDGILLYREAGAMPGPALDELIGQVQALDMEAVLAEVEAQQADQPDQ
jgi:citrate synthase